MRALLRPLALAATLMMGAALPAMAQLSIGIGMPGVRIGINVPLFPELVRVPGSPAYYAPRLSANYFYYEDSYWVYEGDQWYTSAWYNGPWGAVGPEDVPLFVLRIPVRYYRSPPQYFRGWRPEAPPRWGDHWGPSWQDQHRGWDQWNRRAVPAPAPLPAYQRPYRGDRYPGPQQQQEMRSERQRAPAFQHAPERPAPAGRPATDGPRGQAQPPQQPPRPQEPARTRPGERAGEPPPAPERGNGRGNDRGNDRGNGRGNDRGPDRGQDREPDRGGPERKP